MRYFLLVLVFCSSLSLFAQHHVHNHHINHIGVGLGLTHMFGGNYTEPGFHLHYMRRFNEHSSYSLGIGYEAITGEHFHQTVSVLGGYSPVEKLSIKIGPGLTFVEEEDGRESSLSGHLEIMYEFELGDFHLGPMVGFGINNEESHAALGIHFGMGF